MTWSDDLWRFACGDVSFLFLSESYREILKNFFFRICRSLKILISNKLCLQLSLSSRGIHGGAYFSDVSGWKSILTSATEAYDHTESYRLLGSCLTIIFLFKSSTPGRFPLKLPCLLKDLLVFYLYGLVTNGKYLWSPRREILQFQWQFQRETRGEQIVF